MDTVGRVYSLIEERNMSLFQLARLSEISYSTLSNSKRRAGQLSVETIERICGALGITLSEFFAGPETKHVYEAGTLRREAYQ